MPKIEIKKLQKDVKIEGCLLIKSIDEKIAKTGKPYYQFMLTDGDQDLSGVYFSTQPLTNFKELAGQIICFTIETQVYNNNFSCKIISFDTSKEVPEEIKNSFLKFSFDPAYYSRYKEQLVSLIQSIEDKEIRRLCEYVFCEKYKKEFETYPAAKLNHHAGYGGLLEHSVNLANIALFLAEYYNYAYSFNKDLLIAGALFQDVGKILEFNLDQFYSATYSKIGLLKGHLAIGNDILYASLSELNFRTDSEKFSLLSHIILSHHGKREFGAVMPPITSEAILISLVDELDAKTKTVMEALGSLRENEDFTPKIFSLDNRQLVSNISEGLHYRIDMIQIEESNPSEEKESTPTIDTTELF